MNIQTPATSDVRGAIEDAYPLSYAQLGMLYHSDAGRRHSAYHDIVRFTIGHDLDGAALKRAIDAISDLHPMLRTEFRMRGVKRPLQVVWSAADIALTTSDISDEVEPQREATIERWIAAELAEGFAPDQTPMMRVAAFRLAADQFELCLSFHHALLDGWSVGLFVRQLVDGYTAVLRGDEPVQQAPRSGFRDFVALEGAVIADKGSEAFWKAQVEDYVAAPLPATGDPDAYGIVRRDLDMSPDVARALDRVAVGLGVPMKSVLLTVHLRALGVIAGRDDVATGYVTNGRPETGDGDRILGLFLNTVPIRVQTQGCTWRELIGQVFARERELWPRRRYPLPLIKQAMGGAAPFDTLFNYTNFHILDDDRGTITKNGGFEHSNYPLVVQAMKVGNANHLRIVLEADASRIGADHLERMAAVYAGALRLLVDDVDGRCDAGELLGASEAARLLAWSGDVVPAGYDGPGLDAALASAFATHSGRVAVSDEAGEIDFAQLDARSAALALALAAAGVRPGDRVGVSLDRSAALIVLLVAVIRAGASYVPLDPDYPDERLQLMVQDAAPVLVVGEGSPPAWATGCDWIELADGTLSRDGQQVVPGTAALPARDGGTPAYVIYTSGSTGRPKGVVVPDRAVERLVRDTNYVEITPDDVLLQLAPVAFDASTFEIWGALLSGARLEVAPPGRVGLDTIAELIVGRAVSVLWLTAPLFHLMVDEEGDALARLRVLLAGGDALSATHVARYLAHPARQGVLVNGYGPTEATTFSCCHVMAEDGDASRPGGVPIGRPIARSSAQVLDALGRRVALGTVGELCVGGMGLAHGYAGDARRTAERFVPDPQVPGGRLYRTGDRVRWLEDGVLAFLGRADRQVKVRGHRVEPGEIEAALQTHPAVGNAAVALREGPAGSARLVAWVAPSGDALPDAAELRRYLDDRLPPYAVPTLFSVLERLPLTANGKVDVRALPDPEAGDAAGGAGAAAQEDSTPQGPVEQTLATIWGEVLGRDSVGRHDNFFELGGDSILSIQIKARAADRGVDFALEDLFERQTVAALAEVVRDTGAAPADTPAAVQPFELVDADDRRALPDDIEDAYPVGQTQAGMLFHSDRGRTASMYHDLFALEIAGRLDIAAVRSAFDAVARRHAVLRTSFALKGRIPLQIVHSSANIPVAATDIRDLSSDDQRKTIADWMDAERAQGFDWSQAPLFRVAIHHMADARFMLCVSFHHALLDGWSFATLMSEWMDSYRASLAGRDLPVTARRLQFRDFIAQEMADREQPDHRAFWQAEVERIVQPALPRSASGAARTVRNDIPIDKGLSTACHALAARLSVPVKTVLLSAFLRALPAILGSDRVTTGMVTNGRPETEGGERLVGLFLNTVPFTIDVTTGLNRDDFVRDVFRRERSVLPHRRFPLRDIQRLADVDRLFEVAFNYTHFHVLGSALADDGLAHIAAVEGTELSDFPLVLQAGIRADTNELRFCVETNAGVISEERVAAYTDIIAGALRLLVDDVDGRCDAGELLGASEAARLLAWSGDVVPAGYDGPGLDAALASAFATHSGRVAVSDEAGEIDYAQLDARSAALALALAAAGVRPGDRVGVSLDRSAALIVLLVAVIRAGASYVPLDPDYPDERLQLMVQDAAPVLVVGEGSPPAWATGCDWIELADGTLSRDGQQVVPGTAALPARDGGTPAYVIYTSGSTGRPKGVVVPDRAVERLVRDTNYVEITPDDVLLQLAPVAFDASTFEIWGALLSGARLEVAPPGRVGLDTIAELIVGRAVSVLWLTAPLFHLMVDEEGDALARLRVLLAGGDALSATHVARYLAHPARQGVLVNGYGPTEATTFSCCHVMAEDGDASRPGGVPIGRPIARSSAQVLDALGRRVALGTVGELCVGGMGLAHGYAGDARRTAERFVPDPQVPGGRLYRTGDRVRWLEDGVLAFLGRADRQVKVRGHRVEPGEIEAALQTHPAVGNAAVALREGPAGSARLVAWVAPSGDALPDAAELRRYLDDRLPPYAVPTLFSVLERLPLTANGKVDVRALPDPEAGDAAGGAGAAAQEDSTPQGPVEQTLATIWGEVLGRDSVGRHDNFFELGGDSILSIQIKARAADRGVDFALEDLFERQTVAALAEVVRDTGAAPADTPAAVQPFELVDADDRRALPDDIEDAYPAGQLQLALLFHSDDTSSGDAEIQYQDVVCYALELGYDADALADAIAAVIVAHPILRTSFTFDAGKQPLQLVHRTAPVTVRALDPVDADAEQTVLDRYIAAETRDPLDWSCAPLMRFAVLPIRSRDRFVLAITLHHAILDGWSEASFIAQLIERYRINCRQAVGGEHRDGAIPHYREFVAAEQRALQDRESEDFWKDMWTRGAAFPALRTSRDPVTQGRRETIMIALDDTLSAAVRELSNAIEAPRKTVLLAAHAKILSLATGSTAVCTGVVTHARPAVIDTEATLGLFVNTVPLTLGLGAGSWRDLVEQVRAIEGSMIRHRAFPLPAMGRRFGGDLPFDTLFNFTRFQPRAGADATDKGPIAARFGFASNNFPLTAEFMVDPVDDRLTAMLVIDPDIIPVAAAKQLALLYPLVLRAMTAAPAANHAAFDPPKPRRDPDSGPGPVERIRQRRIPA